MTHPARVATAEARKAVQMFVTLEVPVLGDIENMTGPFGLGAGQFISAELGVPFLGDVPFDAEFFMRAMWEHRRSSHALVRTPPQASIESPSGLPRR